MYRPFNPIRAILIWIISLVYWIVEILLVLRFILKLFSASSSAPFISWLYDTTNVLIHPFRGIFPSPVLDRTFVFDVTALIAMVVYALVFEFILFLFGFFGRPYTK